MKSTRLATLCLTLGLASFLQSLSFADTYTDGSGETINSAGGTIDFIGAEVTHDATDVTFKLTVNGNISTTDWGKFMVGIANGKGGASGGTKTGNGWSRPINLDAGANGGVTHWIGSWVDGGGGANFWEYMGPTTVGGGGTGNAWTSRSGAVTFTSTAGATSVLQFKVSRTALGISTGDTIYFDAYSSGGGGGDSAIDALAKSSQSVANWGDTYTSVAPNLYSYTLTAPSDFDGDTIPDVTDTDDDNDGLPDAVETGTGIWVSSSDTGTNPKNRDTDGDGLFDGVETNTGTYTNVTNTGSNPLVSDDFDSDMLPDFQDPDDDNDNLADTVETNTNIWVSSANTGTNPKNADTDGDGLRDNVETNTGSYTSASDTGTSPLVADQALVILAGNSVLFPSGAFEAGNTNNRLSPIVGQPFAVQSIVRRVINAGSVEFKFTGGTWDLNWGVGTNTVISVNTSNAAVSGLLAKDKVPTPTNNVANIPVHLASGLYEFRFNSVSLEFTTARAMYPDVSAFLEAYGLTGFDADPTEDFDGDGLINSAEYSANTDPTKADTDGDTLSDQVELTGNNGNRPATSPILQDSDGDKLLDLWELSNNLNPLLATGADGKEGDPDGDGVSNLLEQTNGTDPNSANTGFTSPYSRVTLFGDFNGWDQAGTWRNNMRLYANNSWEAMLYVASTNLPATNGFKFITVQNGTNGFWGRAATPNVAVKGAAENLLNTTMVTGTNYYRFTFNDFTGAYTLTLINPDDDSDGDLLPDAWEQYYGKYANPALTNSPWLSVGINYNNTADLSDSGTRTNLTTGQKYQRGFNPVEDVVPPVIVWNDPVTVFVEADAANDTAYADTAAATDNNLTAPTVSHSLTNVPAGMSDGVLTNIITVTDAASNSVTGNRKLVVGGLLGGYGKGATFYNLQSPRLATNATSAGSFDAYAQVWVDGVTGGTNVDTRIRCWIGVATTDADPTTSPESFVWNAASLNNGYTGGNDEYKVTFTNLVIGTNYVASRWQVGTNPASPYFYGGINEDGQGGRWGLQTTADVGGVTVPRTYANGQIVVLGAPTISWANLQFPLAETNTVGTSFDIYGRFFAQDVTEPVGAPTFGTVVAQVGYNSNNIDPASWPSLSWSPAGWVSQNGSNDEFKATLSGLAVGTYYTATRFSLDGGLTWVYGGINGVWNNDSGTITVSPATPSGSSFSSWLGSTSSSAELLKQYAFGAVSTGGAVNPSNLPVGGLNGSDLTLTYFVRGEATNANLVVPQVHTNLAESNSWAAVDSNNITTLGTNTVDGVQVIQKRASVPVDGTRKFLRLKISE